MDDLARRFETERPRLRGVAYRVLGSTSDADDAVQEAWLRVSRSGTDDVADLSAWLTVVVARTSLNLLRTRRTRREDPLDVHVPDPVLTAVGSPEHEVVLADAVGLALLVVLESLSPAERVAFVLHDLFAVPFDEVAAALERSPDAARQLASRARRRVRGQLPAPDADRTRHRAVVDAFFAAAHDGDVEGLVALLADDVVLRSDAGPGRPMTAVVRGGRAVAGQAVTFGRLSPLARPVLVNGDPGVVVVHQDRLLSVMGFTVSGGRVVAIDVLADPVRLARLPVPDVSLRGAGRTAPRSDVGVRGSRS